MNELSDFPVLVDDYGIRPAGKPDECCYCFQKVGTNHKLNCVVLNKHVTYNVWYNGNVIFQWEHNDPFSWDVYQCEFHKNDGRWCVDNIAPDLTEEQILNMFNLGALSNQDYILLSYAQESGNYDSFYNRKSNCLCNALEFTVAKMGEECFRASD